MPRVRTAIPTPVPHGRTARRLGWVHLPPLVRRAIEQRCGAPVVDSQSQDAGFTPAFASVLFCADGTRHFVKAASTVAQRPFAESYRIEARRLGALPPGVPAPRLRWTLEVHDWVVLGIEHVDGRAPYRPWEGADLEAASRALVDVATCLTPVTGAHLGLDGLDGLGGPGGRGELRGLPSAVEDFAGWPAHWATSDHPNAGRCRELAERYAPVVAGQTVVHTDVRDDNLLVRRDGSVVVCDWNWPVLGAAWLDSLFLLVGPRGDGVDVEAHIAAHPLLGTVDPEHIDVVLALVLGHVEASARLPVPRNSPFVRDAQAWQRDVLHDWLAERRGWQ